MVREVNAIYVPENPFNYGSMSDQTMSLFVPVKNLRGHTEDEIIKMAKKATPKGYRFKEIEGLEKVKGLLKKV
jgi:hypothetical protein